MIFIFLFKYPITLNFLANIHKKIILILDIYKLLYELFMRNLILYFQALEIKIVDFILLISLLPKKELFISNCLTETIP